MTAVLTARDRTALEFVARDCRVASGDQLGRELWSNCADPARSALARMRVLERAGYVIVYRTISHPEIPLERPVLDWRPGDETPNFAAAAYRLKHRWRQTPRLITVVVASARARSLFGRHGGHTPREVEVTHDIHVTAVRLRLQKLYPEAAEHWKFEDEIRDIRGDNDERLPDAIIDAPSGVQVIEFGGAYSKQKLARFHLYCSERSLPYQVW